MVEKNQIRLQKLRNALSNIFYLQSYVLDQNRENSAFICSEEPELSVFICTNYHSHVLSLLVANLIFTSRIFKSRISFNKILRRAIVPPASAIAVSAVKQVKHT